MTKKALPLLGLALLGLSICAATAQATITYSTGGTTDATRGVVTSQPGSTTIDFDTIALASQGTSYTFTGGGNTAVFTGLSAAPNGSFVTGSSSGNYASPSNDTTQYLAVGQPTNATVTMTLSTPVAYFGLYWSTPDNYNTVTFLDSGSVTLATFTPSVTPGFISAGLSTPFVNFFVTSGNRIKSVQFSSTSRAFEIDSLAIQVPEPSAWAMVAGGLAGLGLLIGRRRVA